MYGVILAGGISRRFYPFTEKPLYKIMGKTLIKRWYDELSKIADEVLIIANEYNKDKIKEEIKDAKIIIQKKHGLPYAIKSIPYTENVLIVNSNDVINFELLRKIKEIEKAGIGAIFYKEVKRYIPGGYIVLEGNSKKVFEKPGEEILERTNMFNIMIHYHPKFSDVIEEIEKLGLDDETNYEVAVSKKAESYKLIKANEHFTIKYPFHILDAVEFFLDKKENGVYGEVSEHAVVRNSYVAKTAKIGNFSKVVNSYIGENVIIGDHTLIRDSIIEDGVIIGRSEIARSHVNENTMIHGAYIGDSVVGKNVNIGFGSVTANFRHDGKEIMFYTKDGAKIRTGRNKLGAFIRDGVHLGIMTKIYPGRIVDRDTLPGEEVRFLKNE